MLVKHFATPVYHITEIENVAQEHTSKIDTWLINHPWIEALKITTTVPDFNSLDRTFIFTEVCYNEVNEPDELA